MAGDGDDERERDRRQAGERREQDAGEPGEATTDAPRERGELVRRPAHRLHRALVLRGRGDREPDCGCSASNAHNRKVTTNVMPMM